MNRFKLINLIKLNGFMPSKGRDATEAEKGDLVNWIVDVYWYDMQYAKQTPEEVQRAIAESAITVFDTAFSNKAPFDGRLMMACLPNSLCYYAWHRDHGFIELTEDQFTIYVNL